MKQSLVRKTIVLLAVLGMLAFSGCTASKPTPTDEPLPAAEIKPVVNATGVVIPAHWTTLSMPVAGTVEEIRAQENDVVETGQVMVRLRGTESLQAAVAAAKLELASAQHALDELYKDPELKLAESNQAVVDARKAIRDAERRIANLHTPTGARDIEQTRANLAILKDKLDHARKDYRPYENKPEDNLVRAGLLSRVAQLEKQYDDLVRKLNNQLGSANKLDLQEAESDLGLAKAQLVTAERDVEINKVGPDPQEVTLANARLENAKAQLAAAEAALKDLELPAPFPGRVSELSVKEGQWITPGQPVLQLADLENLQIETTDLNEIDVARIKVGDTAAVSFDALPGVSVRGKVTKIAPKAATGAGVNYTVTVVLEEVPSNLRWGMTAFVDIEVG